MLSTAALATSASSRRAAELMASEANEKATSGRRGLAETRSPRCVFHIYFPHSPQT